MDRVTCECGLTITEKNLERHRDGQRHQDAMALLETYAVSPLEDGGYGAAEDVDEGTSSAAPRRKVTSIGGRGAAKQAALDEARAIADKLQAEAIESLALAPVVAQFWEDHAQDNSDNWTILCRNHPELLKKTLKAADYWAYAGLGKFALGIAAGVGVEVGFLSADGGIARMVGITAAWEKVMAERVDLQQEIADQYNAGATHSDGGGRWVGALRDFG